MELTFEIIGYQDDAMFDDYHDGAFQSFDVATIKVLSGELADKTFHVYVPAGTEDAALWARTGTAHSAEVNPDDLQGQDILFTGAFALKGGK